MKGQAWMLAKSKFHIRSRWSYHFFSFPIHALNLRQFWCSQDTIEWINHPGKTTVSQTYSLRITSHISHFEGFFEDFAMTCYHSEALILRFSPQNHMQNFWRWTQNLTEVSICHTIFVQNMFGKKFNAHVNNRHKDIERWLEGECLIRQLTQCVQHVILFCQFCLSVFLSAPFVLECEAAPRTLPASMQLHLSSKLSVNYATCCCSQTWPNQASSIKSKTFGSVWYNLIHMHIYKHWYTISPWKNLIPCWGAGNLVVRWPFRHCPDTLCKENMAIIGIAWNCLLAQQCIFCPWPMSYQLIWAWGCTGLPGCCYRFSKARKLDGNRWPQESYK